MIASPDELDEMRRALEGVLGMEEARDAPTVARSWREDWLSLCEMGLTTFSLPEGLGGFGMEAAAALVTSRALGAALHGSPYPAIVSAAFALSRGLDRGRRTSTCDAIASGQCVPTLAFLDPSARIDREGDVLRVRGTARVVLGAAESDGFLLLPHGSTDLLYVERGEAVSLATTHDFDVTRSVADVTFEGASAVALESAPNDRELTERLFGLLLAGDAIGGAERMLERIRLYALDREAFGRPIGGFQAVQHRLVDHAVGLRAMTLLASDAADGLTRGQGDASRRVLLAESAVASGTLPLLHDLVQLGGGIAFTWEHGLHFYERRAQLDARLARNPRAARRSLASIEGWSAPA